MTRTSHGKTGHFFASRLGVCVYVTIQQQAFRVRFASLEAHGVVAEGEGQRAEEALAIARAALEQQAANLAPLFAKVARSMT
jgi:hypothetical protein